MRPPKDPIQLRARYDRAFRERLLTDAVDALLADDLEGGKAKIRNFIKATTGFEQLAKQTGIPSKSLIRMFGPGNPNARNLVGVLGALQRLAGIRLSTQPIRDLAMLRGKDPAPTGA